MLISSKIMSMEQKHLSTAKMFLGLSFAALVLGVAFLGSVFLSAPAFLSPTESIPSPTPTITVFFSPTTLPATDTPTPQLTVLPSSTPTSVPVPDSFYIIGIIGHQQVYHLGCEASAAVDWANYFSVPIYEYTFQVSLPHSENPDYGFVGDVNSEWGQVPPYAYGVYAGPVADLLQQYGLPAKAVKGYTLEEVKAKLADAKPIIVWVIGNIEGGVPAEYTDSQGRTTIVAAYEHVVILTGYSTDSIRYMTNGKIFDTPTEVFLNSWGILGNMAIIYE
jgi:uncharacterized protein YvpB